MLLDLVVDRLLDTFDRSMLVLGPILLVVGWGLTCFVAFVFFTTPFLSVEQDPLLVVCAGNGLGLWLLFNILFNWVMCFATNPGVTPTPRDNPSEEAMDSCRKCDSFKPARAHHCHVCRRCVLMMDHHCPWMANCIGFYNYRYFFLTLLYLTVGCAYCVVVACYKYSIPRLSKVQSGKQMMTGDKFFVFFLCICAGLAVFILLSWHVYLVLSGQTTIEFYQRRAAGPIGTRRRSKRSCRECWLFQPNAALKSNDYDLGTSENWARVFGASTFPLSWTLPSTRPPPGDGIRWKTCKALLPIV